VLHPGHRHLYRCYACSPRFLFDYFAFMGPPQSFSPVTIVTWKLHSKQPQPKSLLASCSLPPRTLSSYWPSSSTFFLKHYNYLQGAPHNIFFDVLVTSKWMKVTSIDVSNNSNLTKLTIRTHHWFSCIKDTVVSHWSISSSLF